MHPRDCPQWEYSQHQHANAVPIRCEAIFHRLEVGQVAVESSLRDSRPLHHELFVNLTPSECPYFAGHYRGESFKCLRFLDVGVEGDRRVGVPHDSVAPELSNLQSHILKAGLRALDVAFAIPDDKLSPAEKLYNLVKFSCRLLAEFLRIHPYANGNGHIGRLIVLLVLVRFGYWPSSWRLHEHPPYDELLSKYRDGIEQPLEDRRQGDALARAPGKRSGRRERARAAIAAGLTA